MSIGIRSFSLKGQGQKMSEAERAARGVAQALVVTIAVPWILASLPVEAAPREKLEVIDSSTRSEWIMDERAWGGGVRFYFPNAKHKSGPTDLTPNFALGCDSIDPGKSVWRFLVELASLGSDASGEEETANMKNKAYYFGAPGTAILFDEMDKEFKRVPIRATAWGTLETGRLTREQVKSFTEASQIRVETPRVVFDTRALGASGLHLMPKLPCAAP
ncbi:hypothetical protein A1351_11695 [Methylosinus sp. R-45379]|uniref:hypothetical protein n=1 Tax=Methylosinus sp. R-45379 TaxID=980563 RepID=UPI0007C983DE|nr:hypothetical protein [Methylosinus sp. R-45379]OAI28447.1 hypothetical protein A1351_11695 [Methylosinus sp. R-45379]